MSDTRVTVRTPDVAGLMRVLARAGATATSAADHSLVVSGLDVGESPSWRSSIGFDLDELALHRTSSRTRSSGSRGRSSTQRSHGDERGARAEWIKLRTIRSTAWAVLAFASVSVLFSVLACWESETMGGGPGRPGDNDIVLDSLSGIWFGQVALAVLAILAITSEYTTA